MSPIAILSELLPIQTPGKYKCREVWPSGASEQLFNILLLILLLIGPFVILVSTYTLVSRELYGANIFQAHCATNNHMNNSGHNVFAHTIPPEVVVNNTTTTSTIGADDYRDDSTYADVETTTSLNCRSISVSYDCKSGFINGLVTTSATTNRKLLIDTDCHKNVVRVKKLRLGNSRRVSTQLISKKRIIRMLCVLVLEFFICWTPVYVINIWALYWPKQ
ncbi:unnamed protein product, partial [Oppiella nova]